MMLRPYALAAAMLLVATSAWAQPGHPPPQPAASPEPPKAEDSSSEMRRKAGDIVTQPARDVGLSKTEIPPVLVEAVQDPYRLTGLKTCRQLSAAVTELNAALGPDYGAGLTVKENRGAKLAEAGGATVVNSLIPFRQLVREISGAAPAKRSLDAAVDAGLARRGFLRGVHNRQGCRTPF